MAKQTTKVCPKCGDTSLVLIETQNLKICVACDDGEGGHVHIPWYRDEGQGRYRA